MTKADTCTINETKTDTCKIVKTRDLFKSAVITTASASCGCKRLEGQGGQVRKQLLGETKKSKKLSVQKKTTFRVWLTNKSSEQLRLRYSAARKTAATIVKQSKKKSWKQFGKKLDTGYKSANEVFWQTISRFRGKQTPVATFIENSNGVLLKHQKNILNRWRVYFCELLNP